MKINIKTFICLLGISALFSLSNCKKINQIKPPPLLDTTNANAMYPVTRSFDQPGTSRSFKYEYDANNQLTKYGQEGVYVKTIGSHTTDAEVDTYSGGGFVLDHVYTTSYDFGDIIGGLPTHMNWILYDKNVASGDVKTLPGGQESYEYTKEGLLTKVISANGAGYNFNYIYDKTGNLQEFNVVNVSGPRIGNVTSRTRVVSFDNHPSPFSHVKNYWIDSYPQGYVEEVPQAFSKNNPIQIVNEEYDVTKNDFVVIEKYDLTYTYNAQGYPTTIVVNITSYGGVGSHSIRTLKYTYR